MSIRLSSLRLALAVSACFTDVIQERSAVPTVNTLTRVLARQAWTVAEDHTDNTMEALCVIHLPAAEFLLPSLSLSNPVSHVADTLSKVKFKEPEVEEPPHQASSMVWY